LLGRDFFIERLSDAVKIYGNGHVWSNFVLGLEPVNSLLKVCSELASIGIVCGANVLHLDQGHRLDCSVPEKAQVVEFYLGLHEINQRYDMNPYYCSKALRTSLFNEVHDGRFSWNAI
jgi:hypothetical protein